MARRYFKLLAVFMVVFIFALGSNGCGGCGGLLSPSDTVNPTVAIISPNNNATVSGTVTITATASDNVGVVKVEFYIDGSKVGEDTSSPYEYSWDTTGYSDGAHTIMAKAYDNVGNNSSASITVNVNNTSPSNVWQKTYGGSSEDWAYSIQQTSDGGYIVAGRTNSFGVGREDVYILKLDTNGNSVWQKTFGGSYNDGAYSIQQTSDGGYIVAGETWSFGAGRWDLYVLKLDSSGNSVWQKTYGGTGDDWARSIQQTSDGGYIVAGGTESFGAGGDVYILKLDSNGNLVWQKTYGGSSLDYANSIQQTSDRGYIVAGTTTSLGGYDTYILKLDNNGNLVWEKTYSGLDRDWAYSIQQTSDGGYIAAGTAILSYVYILKLNTNGDVVWQKTYGGSGWNYGYSIQQTSDGGYIVAGSTNSFGAGGYDVYVLKLDSNGNTGPYPASLSRKAPTKDKGSPFPFKK